MILKIRPERVKSHVKTIFQNRDHFCTQKENRRERRLNSCVSI